MSQDLTGEALPRDGLTDRDILKMYDVFQDYFESATLKTFRRDLDRKNWVIILRDSGSRVIQGFSTLACSLGESSPSR